MPNMMAALRNIGGADEERKFRNLLPCHTPQSLVDARRTLFECRAVTSLPI